MQPGNSLEGKVAWITGGGSGIGAAAATALARQGARVILTGRRQEPLAREAASINEEGGSARFLAGDLMQPETSEAIVADIVDHERKIDILVNNAGTNIPDRDWTRLTSAGVREVLDGNLTCAFFTILAVLPTMRRHGGGLIINTASTAGKHVSAQPGAAYTAAKHGVVAMSHSLNVEEMKHGIRSTAICPGEVATPIVEKRPEPSTAEQIASMLKPEDVAQAILFVASLPPHVLLGELTIQPVRTGT